jgi:hypothetical protein
MKRRSFIKSLLMAGTVAMATSMGFPPAKPKGLTNKQKIDQFFKWMQDNPGYMREIARADTLVNWERVLHRTKI